MKMNYRGGRKDEPCCSGRHCSCSGNRLSTFDSKLNRYQDIDERQRLLLFYYFQISVFHEEEEMEDNKILSFYNSSGRKKLSLRLFKELIEDLKHKDYLVKVKQRPIIHEFSPRIKAEIE